MNSAALVIPCDLLKDSGLAAFFPRGLGGGQGRRDEAQQPRQLLRRRLAGPVAIALARQLCAELSAQSLERRQLRELGSTT